MAQSPSISVEQYQMALKFHQQYGTEMDLELFDKKTAAEQAVLLGSTLLLRNGDRALAKQFLLKAIAQPDQLNKFMYGYTLDLLGDTYAEDGDLEKAVQFLRQAIDVDYEDACNSLGVLYEGQGDYVSARQTYLSCIPEQASAYLYMNLGTLYYNGLGIPRDPATGGKYWQKSYQEFRYDPDINYNLGLYHLRYSRDFSKARYFLSQAFALGDGDVLPLLAESPVIGEYTDRQFADELRLQKDTYNRHQVVEDRLRYMLEKRYLDDTDSLGITFSLSEDTQTITMTSETSTQEQLEKAVTRLFYLIYVDRLSPISLDINRAIRELLSRQKTSLLRHHWQHDAVIDHQGHLRYTVSISQ